MTRAFVALLVLAGPSLVAAADASPPEKAHALLRAGAYDKAEAAYRKLARKKKAHWLGVARVQLATGRYDQATKSARRAARGRSRIAALTLVGEVQRKRGALAAAEKTLAPLAKKPTAFRARMLLGRVYREQGKKTLAKAIFDRFYDDWSARRIDENSAEHLTYVGIACRFTDNFRDAHDSFQRATKADAKHVEAWLHLAEISLEKYEAAFAERHYDTVLAINPNHPDALTGLARVKLVQSNRVPAALALVERALKTNPSHIDAIVLRARTFVENREHAEAERQLAAALVRAPRHQGALTMLAASYYLRDDRAAFERTKRKVLRLNPQATAFFRTVVEIGTRHHRYEEVMALSRQAIKVDPDDFYSLADLGTNYLRVGDEEKGLAFLRKAWNGDNYNVRTKNLLDLYEREIGKQYTFITSKHFRVRVHKDEAKLLERVVVPVLERAHAHYVKKYRFTPKGPIVVELFRESTQYAVRTVGLPQLGALGVCFGRVITSTTPTNGRFNWGQVLWHELNHVFTIQMSRSRVPRWLTEGLADMEPTLIQPEWARENDFDIYKAIKAGRLHGLAAMDSAFTRARSIDDMVVAYYQGSLMARFLVKRYGLKKVLAALRHYGKGASSKQVLTGLTGLSLAELDKRFLAAQTQRLAHYQRNWFVDFRRYTDFERVEKAAKAEPNNPDRQAAYALALLVRARRPAAGASSKTSPAKQAEALVRSVVVKKSKHKLSIYVLAQLAKMRGKRAEGKKLIETLIAVGGDGYEPRIDLAQIAIANKDLAGAARHLRLAARFDPENGRPYFLLAKVYARTKRPAQQIAALKKLVAIDQQSFRSVSRLVRLLVARQAWASVRRYGQMAYNINPGSVRLHRQLAQAYAEAAPLVNLRRAIWHLETALLAKPKKPADVHAELAVLHWRNKDRRRARAALKAALAVDASHAEATKLLRLYH